MRPIRIAFTSGTGEGDTNALFSVRVTGALPCYRGVGAIRSDDGGVTWVNEPTAASSPTLAGAAFFSLAVDPANRENVIAGTNVGLYRRELSGATYQWVALTASSATNIYPSVVVANTGGVIYLLCRGLGRRGVQIHRRRRHMD